MRFLVDHADPLGQGCDARSLGRGCCRVLVWLSVLVIGGALPGAAVADGLPNTVERVQPSVVSVATFMPTRNPRLRHLATGFVVEDGRLVVTNHHVLPEELDSRNLERLVVVSGRGTDTTMHDAESVAESRDSDLALLRITGPALPALVLGDSAAVRVGETLAFTGYPSPPPSAPPGSSHARRQTGATPAFGRSCAGLRCRWVALRLSCLSCLLLPVCGV